MSRGAGFERLALELRRATGPALMYAVLLIAGIAVGVGVVRNLAGNKPWETYDEYRVAFDHVKGVVPQRAELRLAGVRAGSIEKSEIVDGRPILTISVERRYAPLYRNARVQIRPGTPLEDMYVDITSRGSADAGKLGKRILPAEQTDAPVEVGRVLNIFQDGTRERLAVLLNGLSKGTNDNGDELQRAFVELAPFLKTAQTLTGALAERKKNVARLVHNFGGLTQVLATRSKQVQTLVGAGQETVTELARNDRAFASTLQQLPGLLSTMRTSFVELERTEDRLDPALRALQPTADELEDGLGGLEKFADEATPALIALRKPVKALRPLARELKPTARNLTAALEPLGVEAGQIDRSTALAAKCLPEIENFLHRLISTTKWGDSGVYAANVRVDMQQSIATVQPAREPNWRITAPCFTKEPRSGK